MKEPERKQLLGLFIHTILNLSTLVKGMNDLWLKAPGKREISPTTHFAKINHELGIVLPKSGRDELLFLSLAANFAPILAKKEGRKKC